MGPYHGSCTTLRVWFCHHAFTDSGQVEAGADLGAMDRFGKRVEDITADQAPLEIGAKGNVNNTALHGQVNSESYVASSNDSKQDELLEVSYHG